MRHAGVVHQDRYRPERRADPVHHAFHRGVIGDVRRDGNRSSAIGIDIGDQRFRGIGAGKIIHANRRALPRQPACDRPPNASATSCHKRHLITPCRHASLQNRPKLFADRQITARQQPGWSQHPDEQAKVLPIDRDQCIARIMLSGSRFNQK